MIERELFTTILLSIGLDERVIGYILLSALVERTKLSIGSEELDGSIIDFDVVTTQLYRFRLVCLCLQLS